MTTKLKDLKEGDYFSFPDSEKDVFVKTGRTDKRHRVYYNRLSRWGYKMLVF